MPRVAPVIPDETDLLCEGCGYILNGLREDGQCPECGRPIEQSIGTHRTLPDWEKHRKQFGNFMRTSWIVLVRPTRFFRSLLTRRDAGPALRFARIHWILTSIAFALAAIGHVSNLFGSVGWDSAEGFARHVLFIVLVVFILKSIIYAMIAGTTRLAAMLTRWEAAYRGLRLPMPVVLRGMYYHAAHYAPVAFVALLLVFGFRFGVALGWIDIKWIDYYIYTICAAVVLSAIYLFHTYWIAMRNMMYANR
jgi:hypothetical protein